MNSTTYHVWDNIKSLAENGTGIYHCSDARDIKCINELVNAGYITVSWKTTSDAVFYITGETEQNTVCLSD